LFADSLVFVRHNGGWLWSADSGESWLPLTIPRSERFFGSNLRAVTDPEGGTSIFTGSAGGVWVMDLPRS
jgi:hypothetical protein